MSDRDRNTKLRALLKKYKRQLPRGVVKDISENIKYNELGVAFESFCNMAFEYDVNIDTEDFEIIGKIGDSFQLNEEAWSFLRKS